MDDGVLQKARNFARPLLEGSTFDSGEDVLAHADAMVQMLAQMGDSQDMQAACYLVYACDHLSKPAEVLGKARLLRATLRISESSTHSSRIDQ